MKDQSFTLMSLARKINREDVFKDNSLFNDVIRNNCILQAYERSQNLYSPPLNIGTIKLRNKVGYRLSNLSDKLVLRRALENLKNSYPLTLKHRNTIGLEIKSYLKEGTKYRIYKLDIASFFESIDTNTLQKLMMDIDSLSIQTRHVLVSFFDSFREQFGNIGIPRGVEISSFAAELIMQEFDTKIKNHSDVFYYSRFVDDILIVTSSEEKENDFYKWLKTILPKGLKFNHNKKSIITVDNRSQETPAPTIGKVNADFSYLGYRFCVIDPLSKPKNGALRKVVINLSKTKVNKIKTRISRSIYSFTKNNDFKLLYDRLFFLTSNRNLLNKKSSIIVPTGIYYNYPLLSKHSDSLKELDKFLLISTTASNGRLGNIIASKLSSSQRKLLLKLSFEHGFEKRVFKTFSPQRLQEISKIW